VTTRREALKALALTPALLGPLVIEQFALADPTSLKPAVTPTPAAGGVTVREMMTRPLPAMGNRVGTVLVVEFAPGAASPPHHHPGPVFGYVLEGAFETALDNGDPVTYRAGDIWYEPPRGTHRVARNPSTTEQCKILVFLILAKGQPILTPATLR
jgi:quercetin dioxygenase-like cupin family protein